MSFNYPPKSLFKRLFILSRIARESPSERTISIDEFNPGSINEISSKIGIIFEIADATSPLIKSNSDLT